MNGPNSLFVKELTLKNANSRSSENHLVTAFKQIKELIKKVKVNEQEEAVKQEASDDN